MQVSGRWGDKQLVDKARKSHSVNRALMANFFTEKDIAIIDGEYLFDTEQTIKMPDWKMDPELTKELVKDGELKLKLSKVVKAVKNDQDILDTLNDQNINRRKWTSSDEWGWKDCGIGRDRTDHHHDTGICLFPYKTSENGCGI